MTLAALQSRLLALVSAEPLLARRPVLIEDRQNLVSQVETALSTVSLCAAITPVSGEARPGAAPRRGSSSEIFEIAIHRSPVDDDSTPSTVAVLDALRARLHGAPLQESKSAAGLFVYLQHELREIGDGAYVRVLQIGATVPFPPLAGV